MEEIKKIAHLADIHIRKSPSRHQEYRMVFSNLEKSLKKEKPDRIVVVGDLVHDYIDLQGEQLILVSEFLNMLANIAPVIITRGNHDIRKKSLKRKDSIEAVVSAMGNDSITYLNETNFFDDNNIVWAVWKHGEKNNSPWKKHKKYVKGGGKVYIDLYHDPVNGSVTPTGYEFKKSRYISVKEFKGEYSFLGDIHLKQYLDDNETKAYCGSLVAQDFSEGDDKFHGYLLWDIENGDVKEIDIPNDYSFKNVRVNTFTDFDDLDIEIEDSTKYMWVRVIWNVLPATKTSENQRKVEEYLKDNYNVLSIKHKDEFLEVDEMDDVTEELNVEDVLNPEVQQEIFKEYLTKIGEDEDIIDEVIELDSEITQSIDVEEFTNIQWSIIKFRAENFMSYESLDIDWRDNNGLYQITGLNTAGKTTIMKLITYILYNSCLETETRMKYGDSRYVNNINDADYCLGEMVIEINGEYFGIRRKTQLEFNKNGELKGSPTDINYYVLNGPDDEFSEENLIDNLNEEDKIKTQKELDKSLGSYSNFMRVVMTTSDTLNKILSDDKATFIDSILYDSGLDIFDKKLESFKEYKKDVMSKPRISCNPERSKSKIEESENTIKNYKGRIGEIKKEIDEVNIRIAKGKEWINKVRVKLHNVDPQIANLNVADTKNSLLGYQTQLKDVLSKEQRLVDAIGMLRQTFNEERLNELISVKEDKKSDEFKLKLLIKDCERSVVDIQGDISKIRGEIKVLKDKGLDLKNQILELKESKTCPTCGQLVDESHRTHIDDKIKTIEAQMFEIADEIKEKNKTIPLFEEKIEEEKNKIKEYEDNIIQSAIDLETVLDEIGVLENERNDVLKRGEFEKELSYIPTEKENIELNIEKLNKLLIDYENSLKYIEENEKINDNVNRSQEKIDVLIDEQKNHHIEINTLENKIEELEREIMSEQKLVIDFEKQERHDKVMSVYHKCVHRDGIPTQMLKAYVIPKINAYLSDVLSDVNFAVHMDDEDISVKLTYGGRTINAISGSGKERTFASVALKFALNQINIKSKPKILLLDEIMGKLTDESVTEFISMIQTISRNMEKVLIIEHNHTIDYDYIVEVSRDDTGISTLTIE